ncbi:MAG: WD40/YVTN/BNR-like repeat-containing protein [Betaproteobacteria bacterium]|jgi:photosystem II stability/assembly factor-like uncharacterized protein
MKPRVGSFFLTVLVGGALLAGATFAQINPTVMPAVGPLTKQTMSRLLLTDVAREGNRIVAVGDRGYIVYSDNDGQSWQRAKTPSGLALLNSVCFSDANTVWAVGHDSVILKSTDQGKEWTQVYSSAKDQRPLMDVLFVDANHGFAVGAYGAFLETVDAGKTWTLRKAIPVVAKPKPSTSARGGRGAGIEVEDDTDKSADEDKHLNAVIKLGEGKLFIAGEAGTMLLSNDNGKSWERVVSPYKGSYFGAIVANDGSVLVLGLRGNVFRSADPSLRAWTPVASNTKASMMSATKLADGAIILSGLSGTLLMSRDNGQTFAPIESGTIKPLAAAVQGKGATLVVVGETGARDVALAAGAAGSSAIKTSSTPSSTPAIVAKP